MSDFHSRFSTSLVIIAVAAAAPLQAQQRVEVTTRRATAARAEPGDSAERLVKGLQRRLDSLTRVYNESDDISTVERRHLMEAITMTVAQLRPLVMRASDDGSATANAMMRVQVSGLAAERSAAAMSRAMMQARESDAARPAGWIGFVTEGASVQWVDGGEWFVRYLSYPRILSVDPSSPAQRAGIEPADTLVSYDGRDVRSSDISLTQLLRPNARVSVRLRRDGKVRDVALTVAKAPSRIVIRRDDDTRDREAVLAITGFPDAPSFPRMPSAPSAAGVAIAPRAPAPQAVATRQPMYTFNLSNGVAGAQLLAVSEDMGRALGVSAGVLVTISPVGSPANESGLRDGDVIASVAGQTVRTVAEVRDLVNVASQNGEHSVDVELIRGKKPTKLTLKWR
jgi:serine protease Do